MDADTPKVVLVKYTVLPVQAGADPLPRPVVTCETDAIPVPRGHEDVTVDLVNDLLLVAGRAGQKSFPMRRVVWFQVRADTQPPTTKKEA